MFEIIDLILGIITGTILILDIAIERSLKDRTCELTHIDMPKWILYISLGVYLLYHLFLHLVNKMIQNLKGKDKDGK